MKILMLLLVAATSFSRPGWTDVDRDKINTRHEVLMSSSINAPEVECNKNRCKVVSGLWQCPYTGMITMEPLDLDIDHVVPLKNAYLSGADVWSKSKWRRFANDESNLLAVRASDNRSKGHLGPDRWPSGDKWHGDRYWCDVYLPLFISIKEKWELELINDEATVRERRCGGSSALGWSTSEPLSSPSRD